MWNKEKFFLKGSHKRLLNAAECDNIRFEYQKSRKLKQVFYAYVFTMALIIICASLIIFGTFGNRIYFFNDFIGVISNAMIKNNFMTLTWEDMMPSVTVGDMFDLTEGVLMPSGDINNAPSDTSDTEEDTVKENDISKENLYDFDNSKVPSGETPIIPMDLSLISYGNNYIHNSTGLDPNIEELLNMKLDGHVSLEYLSASSSPTVLIIHTHGTEAYSENGKISFLDDGTDIARSQDTKENVVAVGKVLQESLREKGISSIHCEIMHDAEDYRSAYSRSEATIRQYLDRYPTIKLVIDLHRDSIVKSSGELVRPVTLVDNKAAAQIMCVVGSNWGGEANDKWERNLALALKLRQSLNAADRDICRPVYLKASTYNQEIAPYSLLLEIGACGNSLEEACVAAEAVAEALVEVIQKN